ncbi:MAG: rhodanese-like domain-containing protein [Mariprofundaceae bacterium]
MDWMQQNPGYVLMALFVGWMLWRRMIAPKLSGVAGMSAGDYMQLRDRPHVLLDVRSAGEWAAGHAPDALHIPLGEVSSRKHEIPADRPVVVVCASGNRSAVAATSLARQGFKPVYNFSGGMGAWQSAGLPVRSGK